jgi:hypothetical protein
MELVKEVGAIAGIVSFLGLALLCLLFFSQARDVRRLRESASFLVEGNGETVSPADRTAAAVAAQEPEKAAAAAAASAPNEAEAFRRAELARQAAERRQRFEQRRRRPDEGPSRPSWLSERTSLAVIIVGALLLLAGIAFGVTRIVGDDGDSGDRVAGSGKGPCPPSQTRVAVLNGTATAGLAANFAGPLKQNGYKTGPIGNTESPVATSVVMYDPQTGTQCGPAVSQVVGIQKVQPMNPEIQSLSEGDPVAVILGEDQAGGGTTTDSGI